MAEQLELLSDLQGVTAQARRLYLHYHYAGQYVPADRVSTDFGRIVELLEKMADLNRRSQ